MPTYHIFDDRGNLLHRKPVKTAMRQLRRLVRDLYADLIARGMTPIEGRGLCDVLIANVSNTAAEELTGLK